MDDLEVEVPEPRTSLVQLDEEHALIFGFVPEGIECLPLDLFGQAERDSLAEAFRQCAGWGNMAAQVWHAHEMAQGIVRLAPQTVQALKTAKPIMDGAWNLGTLAGKGGKFATSVRWTSATGATAAGMAASAGMALTLIAIQVQLARIESLMVRTLEQSTRVLEALEQVFQSSVLASSQILKDELGHARELGTVTPGIWSTVNGRETEVLSHWNLYQSRVEAHVRDLRSKKGQKERREFLRSRAAQIVADCQLLTIAHQSWMTWRLLRVGHLLDTDDTRDRGLAFLVAKETRTLHAEALDTAAELLGQVEREIRVLQLSGQRTLPFGGGKRAGEEVQRYAMQMREAFAVLTGGSTITRAKPDEDLVLALGDVDADPAVCSAHLAIGRDETLKGIAEARGTSGLLRRTRLIVIATDRRLLLGSEGRLLRFGEVEGSLDLSETTGLLEISRSRECPAGGIRLEAAGQMIEFEYREWAGEYGEPAMKAARFTTLLRRLLKAHTSSPWSVAEAQRIQEGRESLRRRLESAAAQPVEGPAG